MTQNGTGRALLIDYKAVFFFNKEKFCKDFSAKAKCGNKLADMIKKMLFESSLFNHCNTMGTVQFEWLFDCAFTAVKAQRGNGAEAEAEREELYQLFEKIWNNCFVKQKKMTHNILKNVKAPIALIAVANPIHCAKIKESDFVRKHCRTSFVHPPAQEEYDFAAIIKKLAAEAEIAASQFIYMGSDLPQTVAQDMGIVMIRHHRKMPARIIRKQLAHHGLI